ncbi:hypothetical protein [Salinicoccus roseus]|uniref:hypothetical protein n=1 Tax=Salinicoccus roseus TaxID=45670 RepID=UPI000F4DBC35|nr:hypothetical protein [Salinicoccus roseus]RPE51910.1 hypothetical protein EDC33_2129 [Salinicoccus roseus]GGA75099.1 hypothetical protein GCM10007176_19190 [Salinicoccus roseus]
MQTMILSVVAILLFTVFILMSKIDRLEGRLKNTQQILEQIAAQYDMPENPVNDELRRLINDGKEIQAVKRAREALGLSLIEGKQYVDRLKS